MDKCRPMGELRAWVDGELPAELDAVVHNHLQGCTTCQQAVEQLEADREWVDERLATLAPRPEIVSSSAAALTRLNQQIKNQVIWKERLVDMFKTTNRQWRPVLIALAMVTLVAVSLSFEPVRAVAGDLLSVFRVEKITVIPINMDQAAKVEDVGELLSQNFFLEAPEFMDTTEPDMVFSIEEAEEIAGYSVRMPEFIPVGYEPSAGIGVTRGGSGQVEMDLEMARAMFETIGLDPSLLPDSLGEEPLDVVIPTIVSQIWMADYKTAMTLLQSPSPEVDFPDDVDTEALAKAAMQLTGMDEAEAERLSQEIDWTNTLVIPMPADILSYVEVEVDDTTGLLFTLEGDEEYDTNSAIMWQKGEIIYFLEGSLNSDTLMDVALSIP